MLLRHLLQSSWSTLKTAFEPQIGHEQLRANWAQQDLTRKISLEGLAASRRVQQGETFSRAVDQFGSDSVVARLGGIASLERVAIDDETMRDTITEMLCAFVRSESKTKSASVPVGPGAKVGHWGHPAVRPRVDVQLSMTVIGRLRTSEPTIEDLLDVQNRNLTNLDESNLRESNLSGGTCESAIFYQAECARANFAGVMLSGAVFDEADLTYTDFHGADLFMATFTGAAIDGTSFTAADLRGVDLSETVRNNPNVEPPDFRQALVDANTVLPGWTNTATAGVVMTESTDEEA